MEGIARVSNKKTRPLLTRTVVEMIGRPIRVNTEKAKRILGYKPFIKEEFENYLGTDEYSRED